MKKTCDMCGHELENNSHGFDQNDFRMKDGQAIYVGSCTYCRICTPRTYTDIASRNLEFYASLIESGKIDVSKVDILSPGVFVASLREYAKHLRKMQNGFLEIERLRIKGHNLDEIVKRALHGAGLIQPNKES